MADGTTLNVGTGGDVMWTEDPGMSTNASVLGKIERVKIVLGNLDQDQGDVSKSNPMFIDSHRFDELLIELKKIRIAIEFFMGQEINLKK